MSPCCTRVCFRPIPSNRYWQVPQRQCALQWFGMRYFSPLTVMVSPGSAITCPNACCCCPNNTTSPRLKSVRANLFTNTLSPFRSTGLSPSSGTVKMVKAYARIANMTMVQTAMDNIHCKRFRKRDALFLIIGWPVAVRRRSYCYLMLSTMLNNRFQRMPPSPFRSGSEDHQMKMGLPTMWSSGTNPQ